ncbi:hypothetical protein AAX08_10010 [Moraxella bovoculi]|nr:hypothetical protein AAX08_10010 [Moraxella bovoculi]
MENAKTGGGLCYNVPHIIISKFHIFNGQVIFNNATQPKKIILKICFLHTVPHYFFKKSEFYSKNDLQFIFK